MREMERTNRSVQVQHHRKHQRRRGNFRGFLSLGIVLLLTLMMSNQASDLSQPIRAAEAQPAAVMSSVYAMEFHSTGWSEWSADNRNLADSKNYPTAFKAGLQNQSSSLTGTLQYQVNVSGYGWTEVCENGKAAGNEGGEAALEGVRVWLNGDLEANYDVYTMAMVKGQWTDWVMNGQDAGQVGVGTHIDGVRIAVVKKGEKPAELPAAPVYSGGAVDPSKPMVALTFDDGPSRFDNRILDALEANGGRATFFMVGYLVPQYKPVVQRMIADGCELGNHSWKHENLSKLSEAGVRESIQKTNDAIAAIAGAPATVVRPPYGATGGHAKSTIGAMGYASILWNIDTLDWKTKNADSSVNAVLNSVKDGDIILMHSIYGASAEAAERIIPELKRRGYQLVTVSELANARGGMSAGKSYGSFR